MAQSTDTTHGAKQALINTFKKETATTLKVLRAYPADQAELQPHPDCRTARELAWTLTLDLILGAVALRGELDLSKGFPPAPATLNDVIGAFEKSVKDLIGEIDASDLSGTVNFFVAPKTMGDIPEPDFLWFLLHDHIHHRGQLSVYLRMAGGKVPSIYGPTKDEPWF